MFRSKALQLIPVGICTAYCGYVLQDRFADDDAAREVKVVSRNSWVPLLVCLALDRPQSGSLLFWSPPLPPLSQGRFFLFSEKGESGWPKWLKKLAEKLQQLLQENRDQSDTATKSKDLRVSLLGGYFPAIQARPS